MADQYPPAPPPSSESERPAPRKRRRWPWIVGAVVAVGVLVLVVEGFIRRHEMDAVLDQVEDAERVSIAGENRLAEIGEDAGSDWSTDEEDDWAAAAEDAATDLRIEIEQLEDETILPWHRALDRARDRYLQHAGAWLDRYETAAELDEEPAGITVEINATWELAHDAFEDADLPVLGYGRRIDRIFA